MQVARLAAAKLIEGDMPERDMAESDITMEVLKAPHGHPKGLPAHKMAVYVFMSGGECLKVGKVGPKSGPRYVSQHITQPARAQQLSSVYPRIQG